MRVAATVTISLPKESLIRLELLQERIGAASVETIFKQALQVYEAAVEADDEAIKRGGRIHLATKLSDGRVELGESLFADDVTG